VCNNQAGPVTISPVQLFWVFENIITGLGHGYCLKRQKTGQDQTVKMLQRANTKRSQKEVSKMEGETTIALEDVIRKSGKRREKRNQT